MEIRQMRKRNTVIALILMIGSFALIQALIMGGVIRSYQQVTLATICINIILAVGLNLVTGFTGQFSLGHAGFMAIGAFFAGIGGALYASTFYILKPTTFGFMKSIDILMIVVLGGMGSITGSVIAAVVLAVITTALQSFSELRMVLYAVMLVAIMLFRPQGLMGDRELPLPSEWKNRRKKQPQSAAE